MGGGSSIPSQPPRAHRAHVDTCYARPIILNWDADRDILRAARRLINGPASLPVPTFSEIVLGETFLTVARDASAGRIPLAVANDASRRLVDSVRRGRAQVCGLGAHAVGDTIATAAELRLDDALITPTDALIAATALSCESCEILYTNDRQLLSCAKLLELAASKPLVLREAPS